MVGSDGGLRRLRLLLRLLVRLVERLLVMSLLLRWPIRLLSPLTTSQERAGLGTGRPSLRNVILSSHARFHIAL